MSTANEILNRLSRLETKTTRGFAELGVDVGGEGVWLRVDDVQRVVTVTTLGRSLMVLLTEMARNGATQVGKSYDIKMADTLIGTIVFRSV